MGCLAALAPRTVKLWGLCCCGVSPETNPMLSQDPCSSALCCHSQLTCCTHGCQPQPVAGPGAAQAPSLPAALGARALSQQPLASTRPAGLACRHPRGSHAASSCRAEGADLSSQIQLMGAPLSGARRGFPAPASPPRRVPPPHGCGWQPAASRVVPAVRQRVGCRGHLRGAACVGPAPFLPVLGAQPRRGGSGWLPPQRPWGAARLRGAVRPALTFSGLLPSERGG